MKIAVTGAHGFIGRHVVAELQGRGIETIALVRAPSAAPRGAREVVFDHRHDAADVHERAGRPDVLLHLSWGGLPHYDSLHHFESERPAHYRFIAAMVNAGVRHVVVAGTCFEYGLRDGPLREDQHCEPANAYGHAKDALRRELAFLARQRPFALTWARLFYLHGDGQSPNSLWPLLRAAVARGELEFPMSGGEQLRDYLPVTVAAGHLAALAQRGGKGDGIVNVCSGRPVSVRALVEGWIREHGWSITPRLGHYPYPAHEPMAFWGDDAKLRLCLSSPQGPTVAAAEPSPRTP